MKNKRKFLKGWTLFLCGAAMAAFSFASCATASGRPGIQGLPEERPPAAAAKTRQAVLSEAETHIGKPYASPPKTPESFDCSGFASHVYKRAADMTLPGTSSAYAGVGEEIDFKDAKPGDILVFASSPGGSRIDHVAILYKKSGSGDLRGSWLIHAVSLPMQSAAIKGDPKSSGVVVSELGKRADGNWQNEYFFARYFMTRRVIRE